jgi:DNA-binding transcriptional MerR regulator
VPIATIKYYLREGLLPRGEPTAPNQAHYGEPHLHRLRLIRALREVGGLGIEPIRDVVTALDDPDRSLHEVLGAAHRALGREVDTEVFRHHAEAVEPLAALEVDSVRGASSRAEAVETLVVGTVVFERALVALRRLVHEHHSSRREPADDRRT